MEAAKASVKKVLSKSGHHDTTVHETVSPAVKQETVTQKQHDRTIPALDREVHQDHVHTTEQPVNDSEVLPEQHHHREIPVEHKSYEHDNQDAVKQRLADERAQYQHSHQRVEGEKTHSTDATVVGEHQHHHVYENIQPIVNKQTVEPHVVHTTVPIHEVHHNETQHHGASALPPVSMADFKKQGGSLEGRDEKRDFFPGEPKSIGNKPPGGGSAGGLEMDGHGVEPKQSNIDPDRINQSRKSSSSSSSSDNADYTSRVNGANGANGANGSNAAPTTSNTSSTAKKPSFLDKLNPKKDADGDGKPGFMS